MLFSDEPEHGEKSCFLAFSCCLPLAEQTILLAWKVHTKRGDHTPLASQSTLFVFQLCGHRIEQHTDLQRIAIDGHFIGFSGTEYALMASLLQHAKLPGDFASCTELSQVFPRSPTDLHRLLSRYISKIRDRLWLFKLDILHVGDQGYMLTCKGE